MLRLMLLRHAKAHPAASGGDHARPLSATGRQQAQALAGYMLEQGLIAHAILSSDALRTHQTATAIQPSNNADIKIDLVSQLYLAHPRTLLKVIHGAPHKARSVLVVGHNPGLSELADALTGYGDRYAAARMRQKYPPGGLCVLDFDVGAWRDISTKLARLDRFIIPADIGLTTED